MEHLHPTEDIEESKSNPKHHPKKIEVIPRQITHPRKKSLIQNPPHFRIKVPAEEGVTIKITIPK